MKKIFQLFGVAVLAIAAGSCGSKDATAEKADAVAAAGDDNAVTVSPEASEDGVVYLTEGDYYTPGKKVDRLTVIDFNAVWCGPCRMFKPVFDEAAKNFEGKATFVSVDIDTVPSMMPDFGLEGLVPTVLFIRPDGSREVYVGTSKILPYENFAAIIEKNLGNK